MNNLIILTLIFASFSLYYFDSQNKISNLTKENANYVTLIKSKDDRIDYLVQMRKEDNAILTKINTSLQDSRSRNGILLKKLGEHDLGYLANEKPALIQNIINKATLNTLRCVEILSGSKLTTKEIGAKNAKEFNSECPWLWDN